MIPHDPDALCRRTFRQRDASLSDSADGRQDDSAAFGRHPGGLEHLPGILSGDSAGGIPLCPRSVPLAGTPETIFLALGSVGRPLPNVAAIDFSPALAARDLPFFLPASGLDRA